MHNPSGSRRLPVEPLFREASHAWNAVCFIVLLLAAFACSSSSTFVAPTQPRCAVAATVTTTSFPPGGGSGTVQVSTARECSWAVQSDAAWIVLQADARGQGDGSARFTIAANADPASRAADLSVGDLHVPISQQGQPCEFRLSSTHASVDLSGGELTISVEATNARCSWSTVEDVPWITIQNSASRTGSGVVVLQIASAPVARSALVTIAGQALTIDQGSGCTADPATSLFAIGLSGGRVEVPVNAPPGCAWSARSAESWITIISGQTGTGNGIVLADVASSGSPRSGTLVVGNQSVRIQQGSNSNCVVAPASATASVAAAGGRVEVPVLTDAGCPWTAQSEAAWISIVSGSNGSGPGTLVLSAAPTDGPVRVGTVTVGGVRVTVTQLSGCRYSVQPSSYTAAAAGAASAVTLQTAAGCAWTAESGTAWITLPQTSGSGPASVPFVVAANNSPRRSGAFTVAGTTVDVVQESPCTWSLEPPSVDYTAAGGRGGILVIVVGTCTWTAASTVDWITIESGQSGAGPGLVQIVVSPNPGAARSAAVRIAGIDLIVRQSAR